MSLVLDISPRFCDELVMVLAETLDGTQQGVRLQVGELIAAMPRQFGQRGRLELDEPQALWMCEWLREEAGPWGRWADWGRPGVHLRRSAIRLADSLSAQLAVG